MLYLHNASSKATKKRRIHWVRKKYSGRQIKGEYHLLVKDLKLHGEVCFFRCCCMFPQTFEMLLSLISPIIEKVTTKVRESISTSQRL